MISGFRWIKTAPNVWQLEGPPKSRQFHGIVSVRHDGTATFCLPGGYAVSWSDGRHEEHGQGERLTARIAKDEVEKVVKAAQSLQSDVADREKTWKFLASRQG